MKRFWLALLGILLAFSFVPSAAFAENQPEETPVVLEGSFTEHEAIVCVIDGSTDGEITPFSNSLLDSATPLIELSNETLSEIADSVSDSGQESNDTVSLLSSESAPTGQLYLVRDESKTTAQIIAELEHDSRVLYAEPNWLIDTYDTDEALPADEGESTDSTENTAIEEGATDDNEISDELASNKTTNENDNSLSNESDVTAIEAFPQANAAEEVTEVDRVEALQGIQPLAATQIVDATKFQWGMRNNSNLGGAKKVDINYSAWNTSTATPTKEVVVAVIDSGVDYENPDLINKMWAEGESSGFAQLGGDKYGFSANPNSSATYPSTADESGHGTHCAGIIAANWNKSNSGWGGVSGVSQNAAIMSVQYAGSLESIARCYDYICKAKDAGAKIKVASCSWGVGTTQTRTLDALVRQAGEKDIISVFASGNDHFNNDLAADATATLKDNPYALVVNSIDSTGEISGFSNYGKVTTDIMAPGSTILSSYPASLKQYIGDFDVRSATYQSFDSASRNPYSLNCFDFGPQVYTTDKSFDGDTSLKLSYDSSDESVTITSTDASVTPLNPLPQYLSIRFASASTFASDGGYHAVDIVVKIKNSNSGEYIELSKEDGVISYGDAWGAYWYKLPSDNTTFKYAFSIKISATLYSADLTGGVKERTPISGDILIDSISLGAQNGYIITENAYLSGTSMACPAVSGVAAVFAEQYSDPAEKLAARVKGAAVRDSRYDALCSTGGRASVDTGATPAPSIT